jgi:hypothetical protein
MQLSLTPKRTTIERFDDGFGLEAFIQLSKKPISACAGPIHDPLATFQG